MFDTAQSKKLKYMFSFIFLIHFVLASDSNSLRIGFWNVENLFDETNDAGVNDGEFALGGSKAMTPEVMSLKLKNLSEVLTKINPDIFGLCEVENRDMLERWNKACHVRNYEIVHYDSPDNRGIDVALFYDPLKVSIQDSKPIKVLLPSGGKTRDILLVKIESNGHPFYVFVNHWPSKYGGVEKTIPLRASAGKILRREVEKIIAKEPSADIIVMGDLNDEPTDPSVKKHLGASLDSSKLGKNDIILWNVMEAFHRNPQGSTYKYGGKDMVYDHLIVSPGLMDNRGWGLRPGSVSIFDGEKYRQHEGKYDGYPFRFWAGNRLLGGYSDHMPIYLEIELK
ncbi:MAG: endonuclease/exonuclease/phosphatase family protein [Candidatus Marinimicrobia bacterium]|jgi:endonuclease/exonuclease/phosphatase family metal-dependent hydrolase|nr:endonuclease/exonuclease/phosphatase family protein [Candidatus Neomarinimicrobiota bacterium]MBT3691845.1 endonuclease/exonuclease/phosphatase family protein [Candidatus Neomarinimicrobiota bacterium]MBT4144678.1 endonuclease/exonuclease/phosphatase family protein [Candidatus Neomarinimicrobiota bacterium]MBT4177951.1 endonuclease/exonuclease/phosphatase family protein [Candidatus Neomarinimicrobiota bacterium]MBT4990517.1 endonuclease/exonuclease/phosphatase family protein [Candidatus Neom